MASKKSVARTTTKRSAAKSKAAPARKRGKSRQPTKRQLLKFLESAVPAKTVIVTIDGADQCSAAVDRVANAGMSGGPPRWRGGVSTGPGNHELIWSVTGRPGTTYTVTLGGDTAPWSRPFTMPPDGDDAGFKRFKVNP